MQFRKKPIVIEAFQLTVESRESNVDWPNWAHDAWNKDRAQPGSLFPLHDGGAGPLGILTLEGEHRVDIGDWIIRGIKGELYPCKPDIFAATYDLFGEVG
jgi:hypothetical protein